MEQMSVEALEWLEERSLAAKGFELLSDLKDAPHIRRYYSAGSGEVVEVESKPHPRLYAAATLSALCDQVRRFYETGNKDARCTIFIGEQVVTALFDETGNRRERIIWKLMSAQAFTAVLSANGWSMAQKDAIAFLRHTVRGDTQPPSLLSTIRQLRFTSNASGSSSVSAGRESLGKSVEMAIAGVDGALPEDIKLRVPVYENLFDSESSPQRFTIDTALDCDVQTQTLTFRLLDGEAVGVVLRAREVIKKLIEDDLDELASESVFVVLGDPQC